MYVQDDLSIEPLQCCITQDNRCSNSVFIDSVFIYTTPLESPPVLYRNLCVAREDKMAPVSTIPILLTDVVTLGLS